MPEGIQAVGAQMPKTATGPNGILGKDDFLKMLVMQLRYQDPMSPMQSTEFAAQLAQFSSVEQLSNINTMLSQSIDASYLMTQAISNSLSATLIGKEVRATADAFHYRGSGDVKLGYTLPQTAGSVVVKIYDESGTLVRTINNAGTSEGDNSFTWDGKDESGQTLGSGKYKFTVEAKDSNSNALTVSQFIYGTINGVRFKAEGSFFVVDGSEIPLSHILEIMQG
jgi:flagellar basal-body rod modification protein FlgD